MSSRPPSQPGLEHVLDLPWIVLNYPITLGMVGCRHGVPDAQSETQQGPQLQSELPASVKSDDWHFSEPGHPNLHQGIHARGCFGFLKWNNLQPTCWNSPDSEDERELLLLARGPPGPHVCGISSLLETTVDGCDCCSCLAGNLGSSLVQSRQSLSHCTMSHCTI
jgi:hypothetical protein